jgi:arylsulfatase A-like enzyme
MVDFDRMQQKAFELLHSERSKEAFQIDREPDALRERYGRHKFGQSALLARRLVEAGVRLVQLNWPREDGDTTIGNPLWDTHSKNAERVRDVLCPQFDRTYATLLEDLHERGLLDETLVVVMGEFGRSPKINGAGGRDHWGQVFSVALAGAGIAGGQIIGSSDRIGGTPQLRPVRPPDLAATIFHLLGVNPGGEFVDPMGRPRMITDAGNALREIIGA